MTVWFNMYEGPQPANPDEPIWPACRMLSSMTIESTNSGPVSSNPLHDWVEFSGIDHSADATGTVSFGRMIAFVHHEGLNAPIAQPLLDLPAASLGLNTPHIVQGASISIQLRVPRAIAMASLGMSVPAPEPLKPFSPEWAAAAIEAAEREFG